MSALGALLRPGCLKVEVEPSISMTKLYCLRKNGERTVESIHPVLDEILKPTMGVLVYQEQSMRIGRDVAGFDLREVDRLRKAIGKKDEKEMSAVGELFLAKAKDKGVIPYELAEIVWSWIRKSGRYAFNHSHSLSYGIIGYITAYLKTHFPLQFFTSWLRHARDKADSHEEIMELVSEAKLYDVPVVPPDIRMMEALTQTDHESVVLGLADIKGVGELQVTKLTQAIRETGADLDTMTWFDFLGLIGDSISSSTMDRFIRVGALRHFGLSRTRQQAEYEVWASLTEKEKDWLRNNSEENANLLDTLKALALPKYQKPKRKKDPEPTGPFGGCANEKRRQAVLNQIQLLEHPPVSHKDMPYWIACQEEELLGASLTMTRAEATVDDFQVTCSCKDVVTNQMPAADIIILGCEVQSVREVKCKAGKSAGRKMAFLTVSDSSCSLSDVVAFPDVWAEDQTLLQEKNCVYIHGEKDPKRGGLVVKKVWQA